jgi:hypothetical protein
MLLERDSGDSEEEDVEEDVSAEDIFSYHALVSPLPKLILIGLRDKLRAKGFEASRNR